MYLASIYVFRFFKIPFSTDVGDFFGSLDTDQDKIKDDNPQNYQYNF